MKEHVLRELDAGRVANVVPRPLIPFERVNPAYSIGEVMDVRIKPVNLKTLERSS